MRYKNPTGWKNHFFTTEIHTNGDRVWFHSACKIVSSGIPTERTPKDQKEPVTCLRCLKALKVKPGKVIYA